jgi:hypothetical protein
LSRVLPGRSWNPAEGVRESKARRRGELTSDRLVLLPNQIAHVVRCLLNPSVLHLIMNLW